MKRLRILHILNSGIYSGAEKVAVFIIKATRDICDSVYLSPDGYINRVLEEEGVAHYSVNRVTPVSLSKAIREIRPDIIHAHDFKDSIAASLCLTKTPIISHLHNNPLWIKKRSLKTMLYLFSTTRYRQIFVVSEAVLNEYVYRNQIKNRTQIIGNPVDVEEIRKKAEEGDFSNKYDVAFVGRLTEQKNPLRFVRVINEVKKKMPGVSAIMLGDGELREAIEAEITERNLRDNIVLSGFIRNPYPQLRNCKVLCITSDWEGYGLAAIEALALGVPVVCMNVGGLPGIVDESCGRVCETEDVFASEVSTLLLDPACYQTLRQGTGRKAEKMDNKISYMNQIRSLYVDLCRKEPDSIPECEA